MKAWTVAVRQSDQLSLVQGFGKGGQIYFRRFKQ